MHRKVASIIGVVATALLIVAVAQNRTDTHPTPAEPETRRAKDRSIDLPISSRGSSHLPVRSTQVVQSAARGLENSGVVSGVVSDALGNRLSGVSVQATSSIAYPAETDTSGSFRISAPAGILSLEFHRAGYVPKYIDDIPVDPEKPATLQITLLAGATATGTVFDMQGRAISGAEVGLTNESFAPGRAWLSTSTITGSSGSFVLTEIEPGDYYLGALAPGMLPALIGPVHLEPGVTQALVIRLDKGRYSIKGTVGTMDHAPIVGAQLVLIDPSGQETSYGAQSDSSGSFTIDGVEGDEFTLKATASGFQTTSRQHVFPGDRAVNVVLREAGRIHGRVLDRATGQPVPDFRVGDQAVWDPLGEFVMPNPSEETVRIAVSADGYAPFMIGPIQTAAGSTVDVGTIELERGISIDGIFLDSSGQPRSHVEIHAAEEPMDGITQIGSASPPSATTASDGSFTFHNVTASRWTLWGHVEGDVWAETTVDLTKRAAEPIILQGTSPGTAQR